MESVAWFLMVGCGHILWIIFQSGNIQHISIVAIVFRKYNVALLLLVIVDFYLLHDGAVDVQI